MTTRFAAALFAVACVFSGNLTQRAAAQTPPPRRAPAPFDPADSGRPAKPAERKAAIASIQAQLKAFGRDDFKRAATYQSAGLQQNFPNVEEFRRMMKTSYPQFMNVKSVVFGQAVADRSGKRVAVPVTLTGKDGVTLRALYLMVLEGKNYRVEGVAGGARPLVLPTGPTDIA